ncbi:protein-glutamate O-methyltransferase CheR [Anaerosalibacter bizertensis]|uniref:protein-glutamate O-methyltransferase n=1 Tax=Anaerosalibacter bizertensis TaxID=932217 RepID=A0A844FG42_9FIRM|nr:protein-glutamate O-methyltransferase CheR [Anaerosalibacter bizertensis]MSS42922.1 protein-glutamate O-methyltransferase CheR [Anaerosalibacter bizertensis]
MDKYEIFKQEVEKLIGINLNLYKEKQMKRRITSLLARNDFKDFDDYLIGLKKDENLLNEFVNYLTINVSEFYRNPNQWKVLEDDIIPTFIKKWDNPPKIWSSACSTGEEPYSIVMLLSKFFDLKDINVLATDIDLEAINKAKIGIYNKKSLENLPKEFKRKYFTPLQNTYKIKDEIKQCVTFKKIDLLKDSFTKNVDLIMCRNVMIYFTEAGKELLYKKFHNSLSDEGILFVGSTEQIILPNKHNFEPVKTFFYKKIRESN